MKVLLVFLLTTFYCICASDVEVPPYDDTHDSPDVSSINIQQLIEQATALLKNVQNIKKPGDDIDPDILQDSILRMPDLINKYGYPGEAHRVQTSDGYILEMHRIPGSPTSPPRQGKTPVLLMHGLLDASSTWVLMRPNHGLGYMLADLGYDVWMGNARGNRYSRNHLSINPDGSRPKRKRFWSFSWHEIGTIDIPNMIEHITQTTGQKKMHYVGHSQGTTVFFVMASERPEYNDRIISMHALAPVAFMSHIRSPMLRAATTILNTLDLATSALGIYEFAPSRELMDVLGETVCKIEAAFKDVCSNILFLIGGYDSPQFNTTMYPIVEKHTPAGASANQLIHYGQLIRSGKFRQYDHGSITNLIKYGRPTPPNYNLANIRAPVALHYSLNDLMAEPIDVDELERKLPNVIEKILISDPEFSHVDFIWAIDVKHLVYNKLTSIMKDYDDREL